MALASSKVIFEQVREFPDISSDSVDKGNLVFCINVIANAKLLADFNRGYQTGQTRNSLQYHVSSGQSGGLNDSSGKKAEESLDRPEKGAATFGATTDHAVYPEFGTRKMAPQPYLRPSIALATGADFNKVKKAIDEEMKRGVLKKGQKRETFV